MYLIYAHLYPPLTQMRTMYSHAHPILQSCYDALNTHYEFTRDRKIYQWASVTF